MTLTEQRPTTTIPELVLEAAAEAAGVDTSILARAVDVALAGGPDATEPEWRQYAACRSTSTAVFYPDRGGRDVNQLLGRCRECPVQDACLGFALESGERLGLWGATSAAGRQRLRSVLRSAGILGVVGEDAYIAWREEGADREPRPAAPGIRRLEPWPHQAAAVDAIVAELAAGGRCQVALATASGKTLVGVWSATELAVDQVLVLVPSLSLITQTAEAWAADERWSQARTLAVCSDTGELDLEATTDPERVREFLDEGGPAVVYATYQSAGVLADAGRVFGFVIADEAHHLAGEKDKAFAAVLRGEIPAERLLFMTATPRRFTRKRSGDVDLVSMDDTSDTGFGPRVFEFSLADAVDAGVVADYRVVVAAVERDVFDRVAEHPDLADVDPHLLAGAIAVVRAMGEYDLSSCISFHTRIERARTFAQLVGPVAEALDAIRPQTPGWAGWLHGGTSVRIRQRLLDRLADDRSWGVVSNARALGEGVDLPVLDAVAIVDPKNSEADVLQATGRALRKPAGTRKVGTVLLPVLLTRQVDPNDPLAGLDPRSLEIVSGVLRALRSHDTDLGSRLDAARRQVTKETVNTGRTPNLLAAAMRRRAARAFLRSRVEMWIPGGATGDLAGAMALHLVRETTSSWEAAFARLETWIDATGSPSVPQGTTVPDETGSFSLGAWCTVQRTLRRRGILAAEREARLEALRGWRWDPREAGWWEQFDALADYVKTHGHFPPQSGGRYRILWKGKKVAQFVNESRNGYRDNGWLSKFPDRVAALEALPGWVWNTRDAEWEEGFARLERWVAAYGHADPHLGDEVDGVDVGRWVSKQRSRVRGGTYLDNRRGGVVRETQLSPERIARLRALPGWVDHTRHAMWEDGYERLRAYVAERGALPTQQEKLADGYTIGAWVATQRERRRRGKLEADRVARLDLIPQWDWNPWENAWRSAYEILSRYATANPPERGVLRIPIERVEDFDLNAWATNQRRSRDKGELDAERVELLEQVPGWSWNVADAKFERGVAAVAAWIEREGNCEPPSAHRENGVSLRAWIYAIRRQAEASRLSEDRVRRLGEIDGWEWSNPEDRRTGWAAAWEANYRKLAAWVEKHGRYPRQDEVLADGTRIGGWAAKQRARHVDRTLSADRVRRLEEIPGWEWDMRSRKAAS